jgi:divalent metal cation (Fe/Co/Zn/Cd) transporter
MADGEGEPLEGPRRAPDGDVVVPMRMYKAVMVFSTIIAVALVVAGFIILDTATRRAQAPLGEVDPVLAVAGIAVIGLGAGVYAFATRFRAEEMGGADGG